MMPPKIEKKKIIGTFLLLCATVVFSDPIKSNDQDPHTLFLCHFENGARADYSKGSSLPSGAGKIVKGKNGKGLHIDRGESVSYKGNDGNINFNQGTIEFYIKPNWDGNDGQTRCLFIAKSDRNNYIEINKLGREHNSKNNQLGGAICSKTPERENFKYVPMETDDGKRYDISSWKKGEWRHISVTWKAGEINLYVDGKKVASGKNAISPWKITEIILGANNCDATIDEFRISDIPRDATPLKIEKKLTEEKIFSYLSDLKPSHIRQCVTKLGKDCFELSMGPKPLILKKVRYGKGLGMHAWGEVVYNLEGKYEKFHALIGVSDYAGSAASVIFEVYGDGKELYKSKLFTKQSKAEAINLSIQKVKKLRLVLSDGEDGVTSDHGLWVDAMVIKKGASLPPSSKKNIVKKETDKIKKETGKVSVRIEETGQTIMMKLKGDKISIPNPYSYKFSLPVSKKGYALAPKNYLDEISQDTPLTASENIVLSLFATPGEYEPVSFVIYAEKEMKDIKIEASNLTNGENSISNENIDIRYGMRVPQRKRYSFPPSEYLLTTRFLRKFPKLDIPAKEFREIYLIIKTPEKTKPGTYHGQIKISSPNTVSSTIKISLDVFPFKLKSPPDKKYGIYYSLSRKIIEPNILALELKDMKEHGIDVLFPHLGINYYPDSNGQITPNYNIIEKGLFLLKKNHFKGTVIIESGLKNLASLMGYKVNNPKDNAETAKLLENDKSFLDISKKSIQGLKNIQQKYPEINIVLTHMDEVFNCGRLPLYIALTKAARQVPAFKYFITLHTESKKNNEMRQEIDPYVDIRCHHMYSWEWWLARGNTIKEYKEELKRSGDEAAAYYNSVGVYYNAEWYRVIMGIENWTSPFTYHIPWIYYDIRENPFNDLDGRWSDTIFAFYSEDDKSIVSTKIWEGFREGIDDMKYIYTLESLIQENKKKNPELAKEAEKWLEEVKSLLPSPQGLPSNNHKLIGTEEECPYTNAIAKKFHFEDYQNIRHKTAQYIIKLMKNDEKADQN